MGETRTSGEQSVRGRSMKNSTEGGLSDNNFTSIYLSYKILNNGFLYAAIEYILALN